MFVSIAYAMGAAGEGGAGGGAEAFMQFIPLLLMLAIFYFLLIRPQQKRAKEHQSMLGALKKGNMVLTTGGLIGRIMDMDGDQISLNLGSTTVTIARSYIVGLVDSKDGVKDSNKDTGKGKKDQGTPVNIDKENDQQKN